jgi:hypothetical protein
MYQDSIRKSTDIGPERSSNNFSKAMPIDGMGSEYEATTGDG